MHVGRNGTMDYKYLNNCEDKLNEINKAHTFDNSVRPQDDFYRYVNGDWTKNTKIPDNESSWSSFSELRINAMNDIRVIIDNVLKQGSAKLSDDQKLLKAFFSAAHNFNTNAAINLASLRDELQKISMISNIEQLSSYLGYAHRHGVAAFWTINVDLDDKNSKTQVLRIHQSGLGLPNRDYYLDKDPHMKHVRVEYDKYHDNIQKLVPKLTPSSWRATLKIETSIARSSWTDIQLRDVEKIYNKFTLVELNARFPIINWGEYFKGLGWENLNDNIVVDQPSFIDGVSDTLNTFSLDEIKEYLAWFITRQLFGWINDESFRINFKFYGNVIGGKTEQNPVWKRSILLADNLVIGELLGHEYVQRHFPESSKQEVLGIVDDIKLAYHRRINSVTWMSEKTKKRARIKLDSVKVLIGYPDKWRNFNKLRLYDDNIISNILTLNCLETDLDIQKVGKTPDLKEWQMFVHEINAYFDFNRVVICFPAGILQPPFYDPSASFAANLGGIGSVIGHELTHGFDDHGAQFDEFGNMNQWQTDSERKAFKRLANRLVKRANQYEISPGLFQKGKLIIGEAIADIGGLTLAVEALCEKQPNDIGDELKNLFTNFAVCERGKRRPEFTLLQVKVDPHPVSEYRVNCTVQNIDKFYSTYNLTENDKLYLDTAERVNIW